MSTLHNELGTLTLDAEGIATIEMKMAGKVNKINAAFLSGLQAMIEAIAATPAVKGVVLTSGHKDFCVGADLDTLFPERDPLRVKDAVVALHKALRALEKGPPVAAALCGSALGGGYELALAAHHRVVLDSASLSLGLPEVQLGVIPGGGGTQRLPRVIGIQPALEAIAQSKLVRGNKAVAAGFAQASADSPAAVLAAARAWVLAHPGARQPWDTDGFRFPDVQPGEPLFRDLFAAAGGMLFKKTHGAYPAPAAALAVVQEGARLQFDRALEVEARAFARLLTGDTAKAMMRTLWFHKSAAERHEGLPALARGEDPGIQRVGVLGAGMMGGALAFVCAKAGYAVVLRDIRAEALEAARAHIAGQVGRLKWLSPAQQQAITDRVTLTLQAEDLRGVDLVIEAVVENKAIKHKVTAEVEPLLAPDAIWASNTSALPITELAAVSAAPERFLGLHFFSPVEQMPLVELIRGAATNDRSVARALAFIRRIEKLPIVVNDGYGFFTTRVFASYILEGVQLVAEGEDPVLVEQAARVAGMVVPPLQVFDEVSLGLGRHVLDQAEAYTGRVLPAAKALLLALVDGERRLGKAGGAGFYDYADGRRQRLWPGLRPLAARLGAGQPGSALPALAERLLLAQCAEAARALSDGVLRGPGDGDVGAIFGVGFAPNTGGPFAHLHALGLAVAVARLDALADQHGERYRPAPALRAMAAAGQTFYPAG